MSIDSSLPEQDNQHTNNPQDTLNDTFSQKLSDALSEQTPLEKFEATFDENFQNLRDKTDKNIDRLATEQQIKKDCYEVSKLFVELGADSIQLALNPDADISVVAQKGNDKIIFTYDYEFLEKDEVLHVAYSHLVDNKTVSSGAYSMDKAKDLAKNIFDNKNILPAQASINEFKSIFPEVFEKQREANGHSFDRADSKDQVRKDTYEICEFFSNLEIDKLSFVINPEADINIIAHQGDDALYFNIFYENDDKGQLQKYVALSCFKKDGSSVSGSYHMDEAKDLAAKVLSYKSPLEKFEATFPDAFEKQRERNGKSFDRADSEKQVRKDAYETSQFFMGFSIDGVSLALNPDPDIAIVAEKGNDKICFTIVYDFEDGKHVPQVAFTHLKDNKTVFAGTITMDEAKDLAKNVFDNKNILPDQDQQEIPLFLSFSKQIKSFTALPQGWAGEGSIAPSAEVVQNAIKFISFLPQEHIAHLQLVDITPSPIGTISFDWHNTKDEMLSVEIASKYFNYFTEEESGRSRQTSKQSLDEAGSVENVIAILSELFESNEN